MSETTGVTSDGLPFYDFRKGKISYEDFIKGFKNCKSMKSTLHPLTPSELADLFAILEREEVRVATILMNAKTYSDVRKWGRDTINVETTKENLQKGLMASIWGADIIVNGKFPDDMVIATSEDEHLMCVTLELGQEEFYNLTGINQLKEEAFGLHQKLDRVYSAMENMVNKALESLKNK